MYLLLDLGRIYRSNEFSNWGSLPLEGVDVASNIGARTFGLNLGQFLLKVDHPNALYSRSLKLIVGVMPFFLQVFDLVVQSCHFLLCSSLGFVKPLLYRV